MKILAFSDVHGNPTIIKTLLEKANNADILVCAGDISIFSNNLKQILEKFKKTQKQLLIIPGNHESPKDLENINNSVISIHKGAYRIDNIVFIGYGTGGFSKVDKEFELFIKKVKPTLRKDDKVILVTHGPPYGTKLDKLPYFEHVGSTSYRKAISQIKPFLYICGHLHENFNKKDKVDKTFIINPGPEGKLINV